MKTNKFLTFLSIFALLIVIVSCVEDDEYNLPDITVNEPTIDGTIIDITAVKNNLAQAQAEGASSHTFENNNNYLTGYVVSSDEAGNFYKELIIQDKPENPTAGIKVMVDVTALYGKYEVGRKIYINLNGLSVGLNSGVTSLGKLENNNIANIAGPSADDIILRSAEVATIIPTVLTISQLSDTYVNTLIQIPSAQITDTQTGLTYADEVNEEFDGERVVESCSADGGSILLSTSTFADFNGATLPSTTGSITAILSKNFFGDTNVLNIRDTDDINFTSSDRCEPKLLDPGITATTTFKAIKNRFDINNSYVEFGENEDLIIEGYVISSDEASNFYKELYIQNTALTEDISENNPRLGFRISINKTNLYQDFALGQKVYIKLAGLALGEEDGVLSIGYPNVSEVQQIAEGLIPEHVIAGQEVATVMPLVKTVSQLTANDLSTLIKLENVQFNKDLLGLTYAGEVTDQFDGVRQIEACENNGSINLYTSTFSSFKSLPIAEQSGNVNGIYTRNFSGDESILIINSPSDLDFTGERCDPEELSCGTAPAQGTENLFAEDFENLSAGNTVSGNGWTNYIEAGTESWETYTATGSNASQGVSARIGSFRSGDDSTIAWLITPAINLDAQNNETLVFETSNSYSDGSELELLFSTDWDGTEAGMATATWGIVKDAYITRDSDSFSSWYSSTIVDLSCAEGTIYFAFKYTGNGNEDFDGTYELDNISIDYTP